MMRLPEDILLRPYVTEKTNDDLALGKYTFIVNVHATKLEIRAAVEKLFQVKVLSVNTCKYDGKEKRQGAHSGFTPSYKKAIVKIDKEIKQISYIGKGGKEATTAKKFKTAIEEFGVVS